MDGEDRLDDRRPVPDPTQLTTAASKDLEERLRREISVLGVGLSKEWQSFKDLVDERFNSVDDKFATVKELRQSLREDDRRAVVEALTAAKEAVAKAEQNVKEQLEQMRRNSETIELSLRGSIENVKESVTKNEQSIQALRSEKVGGTEGRAGIYAAAGFISVLLVIASILFVVKK